MAAEITGLSANYVITDNIEVNIQNTNKFPSDNGPIPLHVFPEPSPKFTGRTSKIEQIQKAIESCHGKTSWWERIIVIHGFGGVGKSELAKVIANQCKHKYDYIYWFNVRTEDSTISSFNSFAKFLNLECESEEDCSNIYVSLQNRWKSGIFIFDNAEVLETKGEVFGIQDFLPIQCQCYHPIIIVTSRYGASYWGNHLYNIQMINLENLEQIEAFDCLLNYFGLHKDEIPTQLTHMLVEFAKQFQGYPLGLTLVGQLIAVTVTKASLPGMKARFTDYMKILGDKSFNALTGNSSMTGQLGKILEWTIEKIKREEEGPKALEILEILTWMSSNETHYVGLIQAIQLNERFSRYSFVRERFIFDELDLNFRICLNLPVSYSLISVQKHEVYGSVYDVIRMHGLVKNSCAHFKDLTGATAIRKIMKYFILADDDTIEEHLSTLQELFTVLSAKDPVEVNRCLILHMYLITGYSYKSRMDRKSFIARYNFLSKQELNDDQRTMLDVSKYYYLMQVLQHTKVTNDFIVDQILEKPCSVVFHTRNKYKKIREQQDLAEISEGLPQSKIYTSKYNHYTEVLLDVTQCCHVVHSNPDFNLLNIFHCKKIIEQLEIYVVVDTIDVVNRILNLSQKFRAKFWVLRSCIRFLYYGKLHDLLQRKLELCDWVKKSWTECKCTGRPDVKVMNVVAFLGGVKAVDTIFVSNVLRLSCTSTRARFWESINEIFSDQDYKFLDAVNTEILSTSLFFSTSARQADFLYKSKHYYKFLLTAATSTAVSRELCSSNVCRILANAVSSMFKYSMAKASIWNEWVITERCFHILRILFLVQKCTGCSCATLLNEELLNDFSVWNNWIKRYCPSITGRTDVVDAIEAVYQFCNQNNSHAWASVASEYLCVFDAQFQEEIETAINDDFSLISIQYVLDNMCRMLNTSNEIQRRWSVSKEFHSLHLKFTRSCLDTKRNLPERIKVKTVFVWFKLFELNPQLSNEIENDWKPVIIDFVPILNQNWKIWLRELEVNVLKEFLKNIDADNFATQIARTILQIIKDNK